MTTLTDPFFIKQGDTLEEIERTLVSSGGLGINLTTVTGVRFHMWTVLHVLKINQPAAVVNAAAGIVKYVWVAGDTDTAGRYQGEFEVTFVGGKKITVPSGGYIPITILPEIA